MIFDWTDILPSAIADLPPLQQEIVYHILNQRRTRCPYTHGLRFWELDRNQLDAETHAAFEAIRRYLQRYGLRAASDLEFT
ncbi:MAG: hypothetical protein WDO73_36045 [Ignavibacteriota bacterium]